MAYPTQTKLTSHFEKDALYSEKIICYFYSDLLTRTKMNNDHLLRKTRVTDVGQIYVCVCKTSDIFMFIYNRNKREKKTCFLSLFYIA
jgi:hypothetical protein